MIWILKSLNVDKSQPYHQTNVDFYIKLHMVAEPHNLFDIIAE